MNKFIGIGNLVKDIDLRTTNSGKFVLNNTLAIKSDYKVDEITKSSFNLIDLIEVGDYVNGERVGGSHQGLYVGFDEMEEPFMLKDINIYEILTQEQYEANCYKVGE